MINLPTPNNGGWMGQLSMQLGKECPPRTQSTSIIMKASKQINSEGQTVWWEEFELWEVGKGVIPYLLPSIW